MLILLLLLGLLLCQLVPYLVSYGWHKGKINAYKKKQE